MKNVLMIFALLSASFALNAQTPCLGCPGKGASTPVVASRPNAQAQQFNEDDFRRPGIPALPKFDFVSAKYFWVYNGERAGKWEDVRITIADGKVTVQMPYGGFVFDVHSAQYRAIDDVHEFTFTKGDALMNIEFMQSDWAIDYVRVTSGAAAEKTYFEWYPQIYDFIAYIKR